MQCEQYYFSCYDQTNVHYVDSALKKLIIGVNTRKLMKVILPFNHKHVSPYAVLEEIKPIFRVRTKIELLKKCLKGTGHKNPKKFVSTVSFGHENLHILEYMMVRYLDVKCRSGC